MAKGLRKRLEKRKRVVSAAPVPVPVPVPVTRPRRGSSKTSAGIGTAENEGSAATAAVSPQCTTAVLRLTNLHHLFGEIQLRQFFSQYGEVKNIRVLRSHKTGGSKGKAYVLFAHPEVAEIAARDMHNYMLGGKLVGSKLVPLESLSSTLFKVRSLPSRARFANGIRKIADKLEARSVSKKLQSRRRRLAKQLSRLEAVGLRSVFPA